MPSLRERVAGGDAVALLVFRIGRELFGVELGAVQEALERPELQPVPELPPPLLGIFRWRDGLVGLLDPSRVLGVAPTTGAVALVFAQADRRAALAVDEAEDVLVLRPGDLRAVTGVKFPDGTLAGVVRRGADLVGVIDVNALLHSLEPLASPEVT